MSEQRPDVAACLTPPAPGGIAVIQARGPALPEKLKGVLRRTPSLDLTQLPANRVVLCRLVEGDQTLDDVVVTVACDEDGIYTADLSMHGGPRIVQRALRALKTAGVEIMPLAEFLAQAARHRLSYATETLYALRHAQTRPVAAWLARNSERLPERINTWMDQIHTGGHQTVAGELATVLTHESQVRYLCEGLRVAIHGPPNAGKSTLANRLAERETALVSATPGTTRDWTEHLGAIAGVPVTFIDTAGLRVTDDPIEQEAIARSHTRRTRADLMIQLIDLTAPPFPTDGLSAFPVERTLCAGNKSDLAASRDACPPCGPSPAMRVSALTGEGLDTLRTAILTCVGLEDWPARLAALPFTSRQWCACRAAYAGLSQATPDNPHVLACLETVTS